MLSLQVVTLAQGGVMVVVLAGARVRERAQPPFRLIGSPCGSRKQWQSGRSSLGVAVKTRK